MRNAFVAAYADQIAKASDSVFLTGDLGFHALEPLQKIMRNRFINAGVAEANMVSVAAGMARNGLWPTVYSIAPFITLKTVEQVRNDLHLPGLPVTLVGNGGGYGYGIMGATHHILEDLALWGAFPSVTSYVPAFNEDLAVQVARIAVQKTPAYLRLGYAPAHNLRIPAYAPIRCLNRGSAVTAVALGPQIHPLMQAIAGNPKLASSVEAYVTTQLPLTQIAPLVRSVTKTGKLLVMEEHVQQGGLGSALVQKLLEAGVRISSFTHLYARGYPTHSYGSQQFHLAQSGLSAEHVATSLLKLI